MKLTDKQQEVLDFINLSLKELGFPPTRLEICEAFGFSSPNSAEEHLRALEKKGAISVSPGIARGIKIHCIKDLVV